MTLADGLAGLLGFTVVGMVALPAAAIVVQVVAIYVGTTLAGLIASPGRAVLAFLEMVALSVPGVAILNGLDLSINTHDAMLSLVHLVAGTVAVKHLYRTGFGMALLGYGLAAALTLAALSTIFLVIF